MKILAIRMSSLGDVILATAFLESLPRDTVVDWVISKEFAFVLRGHPRIRKLIEFDKKTGISGWLKLIRKLSHQDYDYRVDLHGTLRSHLARFYFHWLDLSRSIWIPWKKISKQRIAFYGYLIFKKFWPKVFRPLPFWIRYSNLASTLYTSAVTTSPPNMNYRVLPHAEDALNRYSLQARHYFVVMPSSRWPSKEWDLENYVQLCERLHQEKKLIPVILGRMSDRNSVLLSKKLEITAVPHRAVLNEEDFSVTGSIIQNSEFYLGSDTGLGHFAEALGVRAYMIFGPTRPDLGFGPWRKESASIDSDVGCSPCSKDGRFCYRFHQPYECLKRLSVTDVLEKIR